jgi:hypothetical protein
MAGTDVLTRIASNVATVGKENVQFRALAASQNNTISKFIKDISKVYVSQNQQQSVTNNHLSSLEQATITNSQKVDQTNGLLGQLLSLQTSMLNSIKTLVKDFENTFEGENSVGDILKKTAIGLGAVGGLGGVFGDTGPGGSLGNDGGIGPQGDIPELKSLDQGQARKNAENYLGRPMSDEEYNYLIRATHAEASAGKGADPREQALIMASILNRAKEMGENGVIKALQAKNQFQSVTGTKFEPGPSKNFSQGPGQDRQQSIETSSQLLEAIPHSQKNFTAASDAAYGPGTDKSYRDNMIKNGGVQYGGSIFNTGPSFNSGSAAGSVAGQSNGEKKDEVTGGSLTTIRTSSGKTAQVNAAYAENFQGFINDLEATGYEIKSLGGFADRANANNPNVKSYHAMGAAIDINPDSNPNNSTKTDLPPETAQLAQKWGLGWGMNWKHTKDPMHFSAAKSEQGSFDIQRGSIGAGEVQGGAATGGGGGQQASGGGAQGGDMIGSAPAIPQGLDGAAGLLGGMGGFGALGGIGAAIGGMLSSSLMDTSSASSTSQKMVPAENKAKVASVEKTSAEPRSVEKLQTAALETDALKFNTPQQQSQQQASLADPSEGRRDNQDIARDGYPTQTAYSSSPSWYLQLAGRINYDEAMKFKGGVFA